MIMRGLVCACALTLLGACNGFDGFPRGAAGRIAATGARIPAEGSSLLRPRYAGSGGQFLAAEGEDGFQNMAVFKIAVNLFAAELASQPSDPAFFFANDDSRGGSITGLGDEMAFVSRATNLLAPDSDIFPIEDRWHAYLRDMTTGTNELISKNADGFQANADTTSAMLSSNGRFVVLATAATNLIDATTFGLNGLSHIYVFDRLLGTFQLITHRADGRAANGLSINPVISPDGRFVAFESIASDLVPGDTNFERDIFLYDRSMRMMERISLDAGGGQSLLAPMEPALSADGLFVAFSAMPFAGAARQIFVRDRAAATTSLAAPVLGDDDSRAPAISPDGMFVAFETDATNFSVVDAAPVTDIFVFNRMTSALVLLTIGLEGGAADFDSHSPSFSPDGMFVAFSTFATNLFMLNASIGEEETAFADILVLPNPALP